MENNKVFANGITRPETLKVVDYALDDYQDKLMVAMIEDLKTAKNVLVTVVRYQYWTKRIWNEGRESYETAKRIGG